MSFELPSHAAKTNVRASRTGTAFLVEAMILLVFLMASLAVFVQVFSLSLARANESSALTAAVAVASDTAERFAAYPDQAGGEQIVDGMRVTCDVQEELRESGIIYHADIAVYAEDAAPGDEPIYTLSTSRFESEAM